MRKTPFPQEFVRKRMLLRQAQSAEDLGLRRKYTGEQKETFQQLLFGVEGHGQQARLERNAFGEIDRRSPIRQNNLDGAGGGFGLEFDDPPNDGVMPALLDRHRRVGYHLFEPAHAVSLQNCCDFRRIPATDLQNCCDGAGGE